MCRFSKFNRTRRYFVGNLKLSRLAYSILQSEKWLILLTNTSPSRTLTSSKKDQNHCSAHYTFPWDLPPYLFIGGTHCLPNFFSIKSFVTCLDIIWISNLSFSYASQFGSTALDVDCESMGEHSGLRKNSDRKGAWMTWTDVATTIPARAIAPPSRTPITITTNK